MKKLLIFILSALLIPTAYAESQSYKIIREVSNMGYSYAAFTENGKVGMKKNGVTVIEPVWDAFGTADTLLSEGGSDDFNVISVRRGAFWGLADNSGKIIFEPIYKKLSVQPGRKLFAALDKNDKYGFLTPEGRIAIDFKYDYADDFIKGFCVVGRDFGYTVIDETGNELMPLISYMPRQSADYSDIFLYTDSDNRTFVIDKTGKTLFTGDYEDIMLYTDKLFIVKKGGKYGIVNLNGEAVLPIEYDSVSANIDTGITDAEKDGTLYYYDKDMKLIATSEPLPYMGDSAIYIKKNGKIGALSLSGEVIADTVYERIWSDNYKYLYVKKDGLCGIMRTDGTFFMPPSVPFDLYNGISFLGDDYFSVYKVTDGITKIAVIGPGGTFITDFEFSGINKIGNKFYAEIGDKYYEIELSGTPAVIDETPDTTAVDYLVQNGILKGDKNGSLNLYNPISRAEFIVMLSRCENWNLDGGADFEDTKHHWAKREIAYAADAGIINGCGNGLFNPDGRLTGKQIFTMLLRSMGFSEDEIFGAPENIFILAARTKLRSGTSIQFADDVTREEAAKALYAYLTTDATHDSVMPIPPAHIYVGS